MSEPTREQIDAWRKDWQWLKEWHAEWMAGRESPQNILVGCDAFVARKAAAWAREQALEEAAKKCLEAAAQYRIAYNGPGEPFGAPPLEAMADAIRALKEPSNER